MLRTLFCCIALMTISTDLSAAEKAAAGPATPQEAAARYFAAMTSAQTPDPAPMMVVRFKMTPAQVANHAKMVAAQFKDKSMKPGIVVRGEKLARVIGSEVTHSNGEKSVVYLDMEKDGSGWMISDVNCLVSSEIQNIVQGFKETKDPKSVEEKLK